MKKGFVRTEIKSEKKLDDKMCCVGDIRKCQNKTIDGTIEDTN